MYPISQTTNIVSLSKISMILTYCPFFCCKSTLSYDHRIIDGKESVSFLVKVKEILENPERMLFGAKDPIEVLLGL
jgi:hypothetical protein